MPRMNLHLVDIAWIDRDLFVDHIPAHRLGKRLRGERTHVVEPSGAGVIIRREEFTRVEFPA